MPQVALAVDDEPHIRRALRNILAGEFERVVEAATASEAVDLAAAHRPDLVVLDLALPDRPGQWVCAELRKWTTVPIIVLSALHSEAEKVRLLDEGADLSIDPGARTVRRAGQDVHLTPTEWAILRAFLRSPGRTLTHRQLFTAAWASSSGDPQQYLRVYMASLRRKLEPDPVRPTLIITEPGVGYRLEIG